MRWKGIVLLSLILTAGWACSVEAQEESAVGERLARLERGQQALEQAIKDLRAELNQLRAELNQRIGDLQISLNKRIDDLHNRLDDLRNILIALIAGMLGIFGYLVSVSHKLGRIETLLLRRGEEEGAKESLGREEIKQVIREEIKSERIGEEKAKERVGREEIEQMIREGIKQILAQERERTAVAEA